ncbi:hypothetical protein [uncultured Arthrobacter sp.]|uniref:hypothetical protein n=1 Tax=uncultured Arthrobacter sp. TaxID=114050 RepID=UPI00260F4CBB|nr:hypothetical protein [uncultured Arthrobacter sp.]
MAERGNTTHGPHVDDQMKHETQGLVQGGHPTRAEDWRETETIDDGVDLEAGNAPNSDSGSEPATGADASGSEEPLTESVEDKVSNYDEEAQ